MVPRGSEWRILYRGRGQHGYSDVDRTNAQHRLYLQSIRLSGLQQRARSRLPYLHYGSRATELRQCRGRRQVFRREQPDRPGNATRGYRRRWPCDVCSYPLAAAGLDFRPGYTRAVRNSNRGRCQYRVHIHCHRCRERLGSADFQHHRSDLHDPLLRRSHDQRQTPACRQSDRHRNATRRRRRQRRHTLFAGPGIAPRPELRSAYSALVRDPRSGSRQNPIHLHRHRRQQQRGPIDV